MSENVRRMRLSQVTPQMVEEIRSFRLEPIQAGAGRGFDFIPGQFVQLRTGGGDASYFAIASSPEEKPYLDILVKRGKGASKALFDLAVGQEVEVIGPQGKGFPIDQYKGKDLLFIGVGTGIAPLRSTLRSALGHRQDFGRITFVYGVLTPNHFCYLDDLHAWSRNSVDVRLTVTFPEGTSWVGDSGFVQDIVRKMRPNSRDTVAMLVGMKEMIEDNTRLLTDLGFPAQHILLNY